MNDDETRDAVAEAVESALFADGFEAALIGYVEIFATIIRPARG